jgi:hypothetical protein
MCRSALQLLLHLNSKYTGLNGYTVVKTRTRTATDYQHGLNQRGGLAEECRIDQPDKSLLLLQKDLLYAISGTLYNISRHPDNLKLMYALELRVKTRRAASDLLIASSLTAAHNQDPQLSSLKISVQAKSSSPLDESAVHNASYADAEAAASDRAEDPAPGVASRKTSVRVSRTLQPVPIHDVHLTHGQEEASPGCLQMNLATVH